MISALTLAFNDIFSRPFRSVLVRSLIMTILLLAVLWAAVEWLIVHYVTTPWPWLDSFIDITTGVGLLVVLGFLVAPVAALFVGLFLDEVAEVVEREHYPADFPGRPLPPGRAFITAVKFLCIVLVVNAIALPLVFLVGFGFVVFLVANAYLLGREYFELAALRRHDKPVVKHMRSRYFGRIFVAGLLIAASMAIPVANLVAPLFATAFMVHLARRIERAEARHGRAEP
jgi:CysZ protein